MRDNFRSIIFDFDYTLADSSKGVVECVNYALNGLGLSPADPQLICRTIGFSLPDTFVKLAGRENMEKGPEFIRLFTKRADEVMAELTVVYECVPMAIRRLKQNKVMLGIVSSKYRYRIEGILRRENLREAFEVIIGGEDVAHHKPDPTGLQNAIDKLNIPPAQVLFIGDSVVDAETARRGGVAFAAVLSGMTQEEDFDQYAVIKKSHDLMQMADWLIT